MRWVTAICLLLLLAGCSAPKAAPEPPPLVEGVTPPPAPPIDEPRPTDDRLAREDVPGGFRVGPFSSVAPLHWVDNGQVYGVFRSEHGETLGLVSLSGGTVTPMMAFSQQGFAQSQLVLDGSALLYGESIGPWMLKREGEKPVPISAGFHFNLSPDTTRLVGYTRPGERTFVDLRTGKEHRIDVPGFYGSNVLDLWAPDASRYLLQGQRSGETPGFTFLDADGRVTGSFTEPGHFSYAAAWAPGSD